MENYGILIKKECSMISSCFLTIRRSSHNPCKHNKAKKYQDVYHISSLILKHSQKKMNNILQFSEYKNL